MDSATMVRKSVNILGLTRFKIPQVELRRNRPKKHYYLPLNSNDS